MSDLVAAMTDASAERTGLAGAATVAIDLGADDGAVVEIVDGRVVGPGSAEAVAVTVPLSRGQLDRFLSGDDSLAQAYMRGDVKPVGSTGALLNVVELFEDATFRERLAELV